jgi:hypothetical protein
MLKLGIFSAMKFANNLEYPKQNNLNPINVHISNTATAANLRLTQISADFFFSKKSAEICVICVQYRKEYE